MDLQTTAPYTPGMGKPNRESVVSSIAAELGRRGGKARATKLSPRRRKQIARMAAAASARVRSAKARARRRGE